MTLRSYLPILAFCALASVLPLAGASDKPAGRSVLVVAGDNYEEFHAFRHFIQPEMAEKLAAEGWTVGECAWDALNEGILSQFDAVIFLQTPDSYLNADKDARLAKMKSLLAGYLEKGGGVLIFPDLFRGTVHKTVNAWLADYGITALPQTVREKSSNVTPFAAFPGFGVAQTSGIAEDPITRGVKTFAYPVGNELTTAFFPGPEWKVLVKAGDTAHTLPSEGIEEKGELIPAAPPLVATREAGGGRMAYWAGHSSFWILRPFHAYWDDGRIVKTGEGFQLLTNLLGWLASVPGHQVGGFQKGGQEAIYRHPTKSDDFRPQVFSLPGDPHPGLIGLQSDLSGGGHTVAELCRKAKERGLHFVVFTEEASAVSDPAKWQQLLAECAAETTNGFIAFPGVLAESPETHNRAVAFNLRKPWPETPWDRGDFDCFVRIGVNNAWRPPVALLDPAGAPVPVANQGAVNALAVRTYDDSAGAWKNADAIFQRTQTEVWGFSPIVWRKIRSPEEIESSGDGGLTVFYSSKWGKKFVVGQDDIQVIAVTDGPELKAFEVKADSAWMPPASGTFRGKIRMENLRPDDRVEVWLNKSLVRRFVPRDGVVGEEFAFLSAGTGAVFVRVTGGGGGTRFQALAARFAKIRFNSFVGSDRMNGYWYPVRTASPGTGEGGYFEGSYGIRGTTIYPQLGWGDHYLFRSENQMDEQPMGFEVGSPTGGIDRMFAGFYVKRDNGWEILAPWRFMDFIGTDAVVWADDNIGIREEPKVKGLRQILVRPSPDLDRNTRVTGYRWDLNAAWLVEAEASLKPGVKSEMVPARQRVLWLRLGDKMERAIQISRKGGLIETAAAGSKIPLDPGDGISLGDAPMGMVSVWALEPLVASVEMDAGRPVISLEVPHWPPDPTSTAKYMLVLSVHRKGIPAPTLASVASEIFSANQWGPGVQEQTLIERLLAYFGKGTTSKPTPTDSLGSYRQEVNLADHGQRGKWSAMDKPWRARVRGFQPGWDLGILARGAHGWEWQPVLQSGETALCVRETIPSEGAFIGHPVVCSVPGLLVEMGALGADWQVTLHNPTDKAISATVAVHPALRNDFELKEESITLPPGATARRTLAIKSP